MVVTAGTGIAKTFDPFVAMTAAAAATTTLKVATGVCLVPQRDPIHTAKEVATVDVLSGGRVIFGVGAGWNRQEMRNHGTDPRTRMRLLTERVQAMIEIWTNDEAEYHGQLVDFDRLQAWPKPVQTPYPPIMVGGAGPTVEDRVLAFGDGWAPMIAGIEDDVFDRFARLQRPHRHDRSSSPPAAPAPTAGRWHGCATAAPTGHSCGSRKTPAARSATATPNDSSTTSSRAFLTESPVGDAPRDRPTWDLPRLRVPVSSPIIRGSHRARDPWFRCVYHERRCRATTRRQVKGVQQHE